MLVTHNAFAMPVTFLHDRTDLSSEPEERSCSLVCSCVSDTALPSIKETSDQALKGTTSFYDTYRYLLCRQMIELFFYFARGRT